jgi:hypothetical protein
VWLRGLDFSSAGCGLPRKGIVADSCCRPRARFGHATTVDDLLVDSDLFVLFFYFFGSRIVSTPMTYIPEVEIDLEIFIYYYC